jgi:hypothetical protein
MTSSRSTVSSYHIFSEIDVESEVKRPRILTGEHSILTNRREPETPIDFAGKTQETPISHSLSHQKNEPAYSCSSYFVDCTNAAGVLAQGKTPVIRSNGRTPNTTTEHNTPGDL